MNLGFHNHVRNEAEEHLLLEEATAQSLSFLQAYASTGLSQEARKEKVGPNTCQGWAPNQLIGI